MPVISKSRCKTCQKGHNITYFVNICAKSDLRLAGSARGGPGYPKTIIDTTISLSAENFFSFFFLSPPPLCRLRFYGPFQAIWAAFLLWWIDLSSEERNALKTALFGNKGTFGIAGQVGIEKWQKIGKCDKHDLRRWNIYDIFDNHVNIIYPLSFILYYCVSFVCRVVCCLFVAWCAAGGCNSLCYSDFCLSFCLSFVCCVVCCLLVVFFGCF